MKRRLRTAAVIAVAATLASVAACSGPAPSNGGVTLTLLTHYGSEPLKSGLQKLVDEWNSENPKIQVQTQTVGFDDLLSTVTIRQASGRGADMMNVYALWGGQLDAPHVLADPPANIAADVRDNYNKAAARVVTVNGRVLGYPTEVETYTLYYNKKLFAAAGLTHPPRSWAELRADAVKLSKHDNQGNTTAEGISLLQSGDNQSVHPFLSLLNSTNGTFLSPDKRHLVFNSAKGKAALGLEAQLASAGTTDTGLDALKGFPSGRVGMAIQAGWWIGSLKHSMGAKKYAEEVGTAPIPGPQTGQTGSLAYGFLMGVNSRSKHKGESWKFLAWLNSHKNANGVTGMGNFLNGQGIIPGRTADVKALGVGSEDPNSAPILEALNNAMTEPDVQAAEEVKATLHEDIMSVLTGQQPADAALDDAATQGESLLHQ